MHMYYYFLHAGPKPVYMKTVEETPGKLDCPENALQRPLSVNDINAQRISKSRICLNVVHTAAMSFVDISYH